MNKKLIAGLLLIALCVIVFVVNRSAVNVNLLVTQIKATAAFVFLAFTAVGVMIGILLK